MTHKFYLTVALILTLWFFSYSYSTLSKSHSEAHGRVNARGNSPQLSDELGIPNTTKTCSAGIYEEEVAIVRARCNRSELVMGKNCDGMPRLKNYMSKTNSRRKIEVRLSMMCWSRGS